VPTIDLPDDELAAVTAAIRGVIGGDRYPHAPRLDPLRAALARLQAAMSNPGAADGGARQKGSSLEIKLEVAPKPTPHPKAPPPAKAHKRARR
jgi:hypothetical protein